MPRLARLDAPGVLHHVMGRGIEGNNIFLNSKDRNDFVNRLSMLVQEGAMDVYAWTLIPNHFHLLVKTKNRPLSSSMRKILTGYVVNYNRRHKRYGHLFQNRYKSIVCQEDTYLKALVPYIHLNLLRAGLVKSLSELNHNPWSGHSALMGKVKRKWQDTEYILSYFGSKRVGRRNYLKCVEEGIDAGRRPELVGGGLIRSLGGWSEVLAIRKRKEKHAFDSRILGDSGFVDEIKTELTDLVKKNLRVSGQQIDLEELSRRICKKNKLSLIELCSGSRRHEIVSARRIISWVAVCELGYSGAEVARHLGVSNSCVTRFLSSGEKPDIDGIIN
ncbi:MAG: transposase [Deltaproteobacteria bacterium]|nr:transposase [Deltaproteobacteria bacterium]